MVSVWPLVLAVAAASRSSVGRESMSTLMRLSGGKRDQMPALVVFDLDYTLWRPELCALPAAAKPPLGCQPCLLVSLKCSSLNSPSLASIFSPSPAHADQLASGPPFSPVDEGLQGVNTKRGERIDLFPEARLVLAELAGMRTPLELQPLQYTCTCQLHPTARSSVCSHALNGGIL